MAAAADYYLVVNRNADGMERLRHRAGHVDIGLGRRRVAGGVVVHHDDRRGAERERTLHHLARIDRRVIDGAAMLRLVGDERVLLVEEEQAELLDRGIAGGDRAVIEERLPRG